MPLKTAIHLRLKEAGEFLHNNVKIAIEDLINGEIESKSYL